ncbi:MAG TPA: PaaI family thioesterase [Clostridiales bacterium]|nr:PaaI family thioesterase [Clostridiales bacterium]
MTKRSLNPQGCAHGSLVFALCDVATGVAAASDGRSLLTLNSSINFLRPGTGEYLRAVSTCVKEGKTTSVFEAAVYDDRNRLVAKGISPFSIPEILWSCRAPVQIPVTIPGVRKLYKPKAAEIRLPFQYITRWR